MNSRVKRLLIISPVLLALALTQGCGSGSYGCFFVSLNVSGTTSVVDHSSLPPGNSAHFTAFGAGLTAGCYSVQSNLSNVTWSVSDPQNVAISNAHDQTYGTVTCLHATSGPVTVTATLPPELNSGKTATGTSTMTCK